jgi:DNA-binding transcriptional ArsR family regulator
VVGGSAADGDFVAADVWSPLDSLCISTTIEIPGRIGMKTQSRDAIVRFADMFAAMGTESRLRIMQLLLSAHPEGLVVGEIQEHLGISASNLSHHLDKLKNEQLIHVKREGTFLRCTASTEALQELLTFLYAECCTRSKAIKLEKIVTLCR